MKKLIMMALILAPMAVFAQKFGHVDSSTIIQLMPEYTSAQTELNTLQKQYEDELKYLQDELQKKSDDYEAQAATLPDNIKQRREQELNDLYTKMTQFYQDSQQNLQNKSQQLMQDITGKVLKAIQSVGEENSYICIFDKSDGVIPFINTTITDDVTDKVKAKLGIK